MRSRLALVLAGACFVLTSCAPGSDDQATAPPLDGAFDTEFGLRTTVAGNVIGGTGITVTWVARTTCGDTGCIATATEVPPTGNTGDPRPAEMVFDFVDGRWVSVTEVPSECVTSKGESITVQGWQTFVLEPKPDGSMAGSYTNRSSVGGACHNSTQSVTVTRTGDVDPAVGVADPAAQPARVPSPAAALWGEYRQVQTNPQTGQVYPPTSYAGSTQCLRTGGRCLTYLVDPVSKAILVMTFADGQWTSTSAPVDAPCPAGPTRTTLTGEFGLPQPASDPIPELRGTQQTEQTGACPASLAVDVVLDRTGDGPGRLP